MDTANSIDSWNSLFNPSAFFASLFKTMKRNILFGPLSNRAIPEDQKVPGDP
jgi:hypothetical protein